MRMTVSLVMGIMLVACGRAEQHGATPTTYQATRNLVHSTGPIHSACRSSGRDGTTARLCSCIQVAANQTLTQPQQQRAAGFYRNPQEAQVIRVSTRLRDEQFWEAYRAYGERAETLCR
ncbi:MAG: hypothetical protein AAGF53_01825 [Pseudomonadota bacterium]